MRVEESSRAEPGSTSRDEARVCNCTDVIPTMDENDER